MKIAISASFTPGETGGMEWYFRCLVEELARLDPANDYLLITGPQAHDSIACPGRRWRKVAYEGREISPDVFRQLPMARREPISWQTRAKQFYHRWARTGNERWSGRYADLLARERVDLLFCPFMYALPVDAGVPIINTIPDLQHEHYPEFFNPYELTSRRLGYQYSCRRAAATLAISRHVAQEIVRKYKVPAAKVFATPLALDPFMERARQDSDRLVAAVRAKFDLPRQFVYYPANAWPHKNHETLVRAMGRVARQRPELQLLLTGCAFDLEQRIQSILDEENLHGTVRHLGYVSRAEVAGLMAASRMLVFPSLFEGFGLPLLEAMHLGTPVVCSTVGSLPEVGGQAVRFFEAQQEDEIAEAILELAGDEALRRRLIEAGREQVGRFSYARTAAQTLAVFQQVHRGTLPRPDIEPFRPLDGGLVLQAGHARWYFRQADLRQIRLRLRRVASPGTPARQDVELLLDGRKLLQVSLADREEREFLVPTEAFGDFHALEVRSAAQQYIYVRPLVTIDAAGGELHPLAWPNEIPPAGTASPVAVAAA